MDSRSGAKKAWTSTRPAKFRRRNHRRLDPLVLRHTTTVQSCPIADQVQRALEPREGAAMLNAFFVRRIAELNEDRLRLENAAPSRRARSDGSPPGYTYMIVCSKAHCRKPRRICGGFRSWEYAESVAAELQARHHARHPDRTCWTRRHYYGQLEKQNQ